MAVAAHGRVASSPRLVFVGEAVLDVTTWVPGLPARGGDRLATAAAMTPGGGFNVMAAAARQGLAVLFCGRHGTGPAGELLRAALRAEGIEILEAPDPRADTGFVVVMVEPDGERTFVTAPEALCALGADQLDAVPVRAGDLVYVSGYGLASAHRADLSDWVRALPGDVVVVADPGPLVDAVPRALLDAVLGRADWWSCNRREAGLLTGEDDPAIAAVALASRQGVAGDGGVVVRDGSRGCVLVRRTAAGPLVDAVAAPVVDAVDTTGAGDAHVGVFIAGLASGSDPLGAARRATVAAAVSVTRRGPATAPGPDELDQWLREWEP